MTRTLKREPYYLISFFREFKTDVNGLPQFIQHTLLQVDAAYLMEKLNEIGYHPKIYKIDTITSLAQIHFYGFKSKKEPIKRKLEEIAQERNLSLHIPF